MIIFRFPLSLLLYVGIWVLCMIRIPETPLDHVSMIDKWTHIAFYVVLFGSVWWELFRSFRPRLWPAAACVFAFCVLTGGLIEVAQATLTGGTRTGDWLDFLADSIGAALGAAVCLAWTAWRARRRRVQS